MTPEDMGHLINRLIGGVFQGLFEVIKILLPPLLESFLSPLIPTIIIGIVLVIVTIVFIGMTFGKVRRSNGLAPSTNRQIGSLLYLVFHSTVIIICWGIWGIDMFDKGIFYMLHLIAFMLVRITLLKTKVWVY